MTVEPALEELRYALAEADASAPPTTLRSRVMATALSVRPAGSAVPVPPAISAPEAFKRTVAAFAGTIGDLSTADWGQPALRELDVQGLVGHLIGVEHDFQTALGLAPRSGSNSPGVDHIASTQSTANAQAGRPPEETRRDWLSAVSLTTGHVAAVDDTGLRAPVTLHGATFPLDAYLIVRSFEMWTHDEDIRRATGRPLAAPEPARLTLMTQLAVSLLPAGMMRAGRPGLERTVRLVLTGPGGGTWPAAVGPADGSPAGARLVLDTVSFCRLVANRIDDDDSGALVSGDRSLAGHVLAGARTLALD
jgi:uncharacterized protein (TIGR03083 family)